MPQARSISWRKGRRGKRIEPIGGSEIVALFGPDGYIRVLWRWSGLRLAGTASKSPRPRNWV